MNTEEMTKELVRLILKQQTEEKLSERYEKLKKVLYLVASGATLATVLAAPNTARLFKDLAYDRSNGEWKMFNKRYLERVLESLRRQKIIEVMETDDGGIVKITEKGKRRVLQFGLESLHINRPKRWDGKWRIVSYDIFDGKKGTRDRLQMILHNAGFYQLQESLYLHAYPCEQQVDFLRHFLGVEGGVRLIIAESIENDEVFRKYFGV